MTRVLTGEQLWTPPANQLNPFALDDHDVIDVLTAHPDDRAVMLAYATHAAKLGEMSVRDIGAYVANDGEASTKGDPAWVRGRGRRTEELASATREGIPLARVHMPGLPDTDFGSRREFTILVDSIGDYLLKRKTTTAITLGPEGGDGHPAHVRTHEAVMVAAREIKLGGGLLTVFGLNAHSQGSVVIDGSTPGYQAYKQHVMAPHLSQTPFEGYDRFLDRETFDRYSINGTAA